MSQTSLMGGRNGGQLSVKPNGARLKELRHALGKSGKEVEAEAGLNSGQISRYERGKPNGIKGLRKLAHYYKVRTSEILSPESHPIIDDILSDLADARDAMVVPANGK